MSFGLLPLLALLTASAVAMATLRLPFKEMGKPAIAIGYLALFSAIARGIFPGDGRFFDAASLPASALYGLRLLIVFFFARIYYVSTKASELGDYLSLAARKVAGSKARASSATILADPGMLLSLSLLFLPRVFDNYRKVRDAADLRAYGIRRRRMANTLPMLQTFIFMSIKGALVAARAMELRGYSEARTLNPARLSRIDAVVFIAGTILLVLAGLAIK
jgi:energy-coupling factor transporter transmembrane protein EcfT